MRALARFEAFVERIIDSSLVGLTGAKLQPVEIAKRLARAMDAGRVVGMVGPIAPNQYDVRLGKHDYTEYAGVKQALERELESYLAALAKERGLQLLAPPVVQVELDTRLHRHQLAIESRMSEAMPDGRTGGGRTERFAAVPAAPAARPEPAAAVVTLTRKTPTGDARIAVTGPRFTIGRALDNGLVLEDPRVSRYHALLLVDGAECSVQDLDSTNGTWVNGSRVRQMRLRSGDRLSLGGVEVAVAIAGGESDGRD